MTADTTIQQSPIYPDKINDPCRMVQQQLADIAEVLTLSTEVGASLARGDTLTTMLQDCTKAFLSHRHIDLACIWSPQLENHECVRQARACLDGDPDGNGAPLPLETAVIKRIAQARRPYVTDDIANDPWLNDMPWATHMGLVAFAGYPLIVNNRLVGVCGCFARRPFTDTVKTALAWLTSSIAISIDRLNIDRALTHARDTMARLHGNLKRKHQELEEFTYIVSHDLQTPLRHLTSFSSMLRHDLGDDLPEHAARDLAFISRAADHMHALVCDLLLLSRTGRSTMQMEEVPLDMCADQAQAILSNTHPVAPASLRRDILPTVYGDRILLTQVYRHLIENAIKFHGHDDPSIHLTAEPDNGQWILGVADNGVGIKPEHREQIFLPFKRLQPHGANEGTGIGLSICRKIVERHGGRIWIESASDRGTWVKFILHDTARDEDNPSC